MVSQKKTRWKLLSSLASDQEIFFCICAMNFVIILEASVKLASEKCVHVRDQPKGNLTKGNVCGILLLFSCIYLAFMEISLALKWRCCLQGRFLMKAWKQKRKHLKKEEWGKLGVKIMLKFNCWSKNNLLFLWCSFAVMKFDIKKWDY